MACLNLCIRLGFLPFCKIICSNENEFSFPCSLRQWSHNVDSPDVEGPRDGYWVEFSSKGVNNIAKFLAHFAFPDEPFGFLFHY